MSQYSGRYVTASADITFEKFDGEYVVLNLATGNYYALSPSASVLLDGILAGHDVAGMLAVLGEADGGAAAYHDLFGKLLANELVVADAAQPATEPDATWRDAARGVCGDPTIEVFEDLAQLILADPIHDAAEEAGWPVARTGR
ncbi:MAG: hypothetical protein H6878_09830 [Rhodobiaceae bacterium]|nr:hypothetical protein [Rhodobiaceae bacterium]MCC0016559.1 hypothetical protein [Rhodobiaceae bacterium]MCC0042393.1 hypothetical protein [Rhodobiaceae bacterium]